MKEHHTKTKGDLGVLKAQVDLYEKGYLILNPSTEHSPFDLVVYKDGVFKRIQVKYRSLTTTGTMEVKFSTSWASKTGNHINKYDKNEVDIFCVYCPETDKCYYIKLSDFRSESVVLRVEPPKNNQRSNVNMAEDYREVP
jgi:hypothetical protein